MSASGLLGKLDLPPVPAAASQARRYVGDLLRQAGRTDVADAQLLVPELVANAVRHSDTARIRGAHVTLLVFAQDGGVIRIEVTDAGSATGRPHVRPYDEDGEGGRGLLLVDALAARWGAERTDAGCTVWCELRMR